MTEGVKVMTEGVDVISLDRAYLWRRGREEILVDLKKGREVIGEHCLPPSLPQNQMAPL